MALTDLRGTVVAETSEELDIRGGPGGGLLALRHEGSDEELGESGVAAGEELGGVAASAALASADSALSPEEVSSVEA